MTYMHTQIIHWDKLGKEQVHWLIKNDECFVLISDGDSSAQYDFDEIPLTFEEVLEGCSPNEEIVLCEMPKEIPDGFHLSKSYWGEFVLVKDSEYDFGVEEKRNLLTAAQEKQLRDCERKYMEAHSRYVNCFGPSEELSNALRGAGDKLTKMYKDFGISYEEQAVQ